MPNNVEDFEKVLRNFATNVTGTKWSIAEFWHSVLNYLSEIDFEKFNHRFQRTVTKILCQFLLKSLVEFGCHDYDLVVKIMVVYDRQRSVYLDLHTSDVKYIVQPLFIHDMIESTSKSFLKDINMCAFFETAPDIKLTQALVQYGMILPLAVGMGPFGTLVSMESFVHNIFNVVGGVDLSDFVIHYSIRSPNGGRAKGVNRLCVISYALKATMLEMKDDSSSSEFVECLNLYQSVMPDPFVSEDEVRELVHLAFKKKNYKEHVADHFAKVYASLFHPHVSTYLRPRSLQHLCRCTVRATLTSKHNSLPDRVDTLPVPTCIKKFLLGAPERRSY